MLADQSNVTIKDVLPLLPLKGTVVMPHQIAPLGVGRQKSLRALETALAGDRIIVLAAQKQDDLEEPRPADIYGVGTICRILQVGKQPDGVLQVIVEGLVRGEIQGVVQEDPYFEVRITQRPDIQEKTLEIVGVGYRADAKAKGITLNIGFSHPIVYQPAEGVKLECPNQTTIVISGVDKQKVGQAAAEIRGFRPPEPYKGKGIRYQGEQVRRKAGKTASSA